MDFADLLNSATALLDDLDTPNTANDARVDAAALSAALLEIDAVRARLEAAELCALGSFERVGGPRAEGSNGVRGWLINQTGTSSRDASARQRIARGLRRNPLVRESYLNGEITRAHVELLLGALTPRIRRRVDDDDVRDLLDQARRVGAVDFAGDVSSWLEHHDPDGTEPDDPTRDEAFCNRVGNRVTLRADLGLETGLPLLAALEEHTDKIFNTDKKIAAANGDDHVTRPRSNQRAQALTELLGLGAAAPTSTTKRQPIFVIAPETDPFGNPRFRDVTHTGTIIPSRLANKWADTATIAHHLRHQLINENGTTSPLNLGRSTRFANRAQKRALAARDKHCAFPGCDTPPAWADAHHIEWWEHDGNTDLDNLVLLCRFHHVLIHTGSFTVTTGPDSKPIFRRADNTPITQRSTPEDDRAETTQLARQRLTALTG